MKRYLLVTLLLAVLGCGGDKKEQSQKQATPESVVTEREGKTKLVPLEIGNQWVYQIDALDTTVNALRPIKFDTLKIIRDTVIAGSRWYGIGGLGMDNGFMINWTDGLWFARPGQDPFMFAKYPAEIGDTFISNIGGVEVHTRLVGTGVEVKVPAGNFYCYKYMQTVGAPAMTTNYYFAPGVGLIRMEILNRAGTAPMAANYLIAIIRK